MFSCRNCCMDFATKNGTTFITRKFGNNATQIFPKMSVTNEEVINCKNLTKEQSKAKLWFDIGAGRITASNVKAVFRTDESNPLKSHDKFSNNATTWGMQNEQKATIK
ncbi:hypothetical protein DPMN_074937 [Dreissena polymorpha]|uniref:Uncharacterized protein n=1 Tax=Dreissena polymorpha TaxID=45954 RepID=A0A9D4BEG8_DREPO|nr:hypothetical protein DPMN_074937 [Dreissena polymorpha]